MALTISRPITDQTEYEALRFALISKLEGKEPAPYFDTGLGAGSDRGK